MVEAEYVFSAKRLIVYAGQGDPAADGSRSFRFWADLVDSFGPSLLPFLVKGIALPSIPYGKLGLRAVEPKALVSKSGEMWILFCYSDSVRRNVAMGSPLRADGFPLILEWRHRTVDSPLLSGAFHRLADLVRRQLAVDGWGLHPAFGRYGDKIDFTDPALFSDEQDISQVASAYGALVSGLFCAATGRFPPRWTFPTLQWDGTCGQVTGVAGIERKLKVACDFGAEYFTVARAQLKTAKRLTEALNASVHGRIEPYGVGSALSPAKIAEDIAWGAIRKRRRKWWGRVGVVAAVVGVVAAMVVQRQVIMRRHDLGSIGEASRILRFPGATTAECEEAWRDIRTRLRYAEARNEVARLVVSSNWLIPIEVNELVCTNGAPYLSGLHPGRAESGALMFWIPCNFDCWFTVNTRGIAVEIPKGREVWRKSGSGWCGIETVRVSPCGRVALLEIALPTRRFVAVDPYKGTVLWQHPIDGRISAFAFSLDGRRIAFAERSGGDVFLCDLMTGRRVTRTLKVSPAPYALAFTEDCTRLKVAVADREIVCSIAVQFPSEDGGACSESWLGETEKDAAEILDFLTLRFDSTSVSLGPVSSASRAVSSVLAYARLSPSDRSLNLLSERAFREYSAGIKDVIGWQGVLAFQPNESNAFFSTWIKQVDALAQRNAIHQIGRLQVGYEEIVHSYYALDAQSLLFDRVLIRFADMQFPGNPAVAKRAGASLLWTGVNPLDKSTWLCPHVAPQAETNSAATDAWVRDCAKAELDSDEELTHVGELGDALTHCIGRYFTADDLSDINAQKAWENVCRCNELALTSLAVAFLDVMKRLEEAAGRSVDWMESVRLFLEEGPSRVGQWATILRRDDESCVSDEMGWLMTGDVLTHEGDGNPDHWCVLRADPPRGRLKRIKSISGYNRLFYDILQQTNDAPRKIRSWYLPGYGKKADPQMVELMKRIYERSKGAGK